MGYTAPQDRQQTRFSAFEEPIDKDNPVRFIDAFVDALELDKLDFKVTASKTEGRPAFEPKIFLKPYFNGYLNGIRSSRRLERECLLNIELQWLLAGLVPNYHIKVKASDSKKNNYSEKKVQRHLAYKMNEHIFGTIKRQWGYNHTNLKGLNKVNGEWL